MARRVEDLELLFSVLAAESASEPVELKGARVAWYTEDGIAPVTRETRAAVQDSVSSLADAGLTVEECRVPGIERGYELWSRLFSRASVVQLRDVYGEQAEKGGSFVRWRLATADEMPAPTLDEYIQGWMDRDRLRFELLRWMADVPLIVAPVGATNALPHDTLKIDIDGVKLGTFRAFSYCQTFNVFDLPSVCIPAGRSPDRFPIGVQIVGRPWGEREVLAAARIVEEAFQAYDTT
jgi:Asp-tRNA(Asn)/Glu-tRNA(Gln) amidotransferase A subunit family amidase